MYQHYMHPTLYTPATRPLDKLLMAVNEQRAVTDGSPEPQHVPLWRQVLCTEDAISSDQLEEALNNLRRFLLNMDAGSKVSVFVRVRNLDVLRRLLDMDGVRKLTGFVLPKVGPESFLDYAEEVVGTDFRLMPILEHRLMFDRHFREALLSVFQTEPFRTHIDCVRIGANDLLGYLDLRRAHMTYTVYDTPIRGLIENIILEFKGIGNFPVTAPVFECFHRDYDALLRTEVKRHVLNGLFGQTAIHVRHLRLIRDEYRVSPADAKSSMSMQADEGQAVVGRNGRMDEISTHGGWSANNIAVRLRLFGSTEVSDSFA